MKKIFLFLFLSVFLAGAAVPPKYVPNYYDTNETFTINQFITNIVGSLTSTGGMSFVSASNLVNNIIITSNGNWIATKNGVSRGELTTENISSARIWATATNSQPFRFFSLWNPSGMSDALMAWKNTTTNGHTAVDIQDINGGYIASFGYADGKVKPAAYELSNRFFIAISKNAADSVNTTDTGEFLIRQENFDSGLKTYFPLHILTNGTVRINYSDPARAGGGNSDVYAAPLAVSVNGVNGNLHSAGGIISSNGPQNPTGGVYFKSTDGNTGLFMSDGDNGTLYGYDPIFGKVWFKLRTNAPNDSLVIGPTGISMSTNLYLAGAESNAAPVNAVGQLADGRMVKIALSSGGGAGGFPVTDALGNYIAITNTPGTIAFGISNTPAPRGIYMIGAAHGGANMRLGINTTNPAANLDVPGTLYVGTIIATNGGGSGSDIWSSNSQARVRLALSNGPAATFVGIAGGSTTYTFINSNYVMDLQPTYTFNVNGSAQINGTGSGTNQTGLTVASSGNVGIGTANPAANLDVPGTSAIGTLLGTNITAVGFDFYTNSFIGTTFWFGTNQTIVCSSNIYIQTLGNLPTTTERMGQLTIVASGGDVTVTNLAALRCSDGLVTRVVESGKRFVIGAHVQVPLFTNAAVVKF